MKESTSNLFMSFAGLRLLLTSNFKYFEDRNKMGGVELTWNGEYLEYEFKITSPDIWIKIGRGFPTFAIRGDFEYENVNEILIDEIYEIETNINNFIHERSGGLD